MGGVEVFYRCEECLFEIIKRFVDMANLPYSVIVFQDF